MSAGAVVVVGFLRRRCPACDAPMAIRPIGLLPAKAGLPPPKTKDDAAVTLAADEGVRQESQSIATQLAEAIALDPAAAATQWLGQRSEPSTLAGVKVRYTLQANSCVWCRRDWLFAVRPPAYQRDLATELPNGSASVFAHHLNKARQPH